MIINVDLWQYTSVYLKYGTGHVIFNLYGVLETGTQIQDNVVPIMNILNENW